MDVFRILLITAVWMGPTLGESPTDLSSGSERAAEPLTSGKLRIVTIHHPPYVFVSKNKTFSGFLVDLIGVLSKKLNFASEFYEVPDDKYGSKKLDGSWNGMIGEVMSLKHNPDGNLTDPKKDVGADLAAAALLITSARNEAVEFLYPFHHLGLTVVVQKHYMQQNYTYEWPTFGIFRPLTASVWAMIVLTMFAVGLLLSLMNHFNPYEWGGRFTLGQASKHHKESFNFSGSMWFAFSTLQWQGFERAPRSIASKILTCFWFGFVTISIITYTGGLINNLWWASMAQRHNPLKHPATSLRGLISGIHGNDFQIGCTQGSATFRYLTEVASPKMVEFNLLKVYWSTDHGKNQLVTSVDEGLAKVRKEKYAFFMESLEAKYHMNKHPCDLTSIEEFAYRSYGLAVPKNWPHREKFNSAIMEIQEDGQLDELERKWWEGQGECWNSTFIETIVQAQADMHIRDAKPKVIDLNMFWGPLVGMVVGAFLSLAVGVAEILYYKYKGRYQESNRPQGQTLNLDHDDGNI